MEKIITHIIAFIKGLSKVVLVGIFLLIATLTAIIWIIFGSNKESRISFSKNTQIDISPIHIQSMEEIGQWEFLSITTEELIDTTKRSPLGDKVLTKIYYGTLRLGVHMDKAEPKWIRVEEDSIVVATLPAIELLDHRFIDETKTQSFYEKGQWEGKDREALYLRAYNKMKQRYMTEANIKKAENNAVYQFTKLLKTMGYNNVRVEFNPSKTTSQTKK